MRLISKFVDLRLKKCGALFFSRMIERKTVCIKRLVNGAAEKKRFERWIRHTDVTKERLIQTEQARVRTPIWLIQHAMSDRCGFIIRPVLQYEMLHQYFD